VSTTAYLVDTPGPLVDASYLMDDEVQLLGQLQGGPVPTVSIVQRKYHVFQALGMNENKSGTALN
jgi:hypothetical protein